MDPDLLKQLSDMLSEKDIDLNQILENFQSTSSNENTTNSQNDSNQFDPEILLKMQKLLSLLNKNKEIKELYNKGKVLKIYNAGTKVYVWTNKNS